MKEVQKAVVRRGGKFLILFRSPDAKTFPKHWDFPGGKLEPNETPAAGIEREVSEETGLKVKALKVVGVYEMAPSNAPCRFSVWFIKLLSDKEVRLSHEHTEFRWATREEILKLKVEPYIEEYFKGN